MEPSTKVGLATLAGAVLGTLLANWLQVKREERRAAAELESILWGIHAEIVEIVDHYFHAIGNSLEQDLHPNTLFDRYMVADQPYFTIYQSAADKLGHLNNPELMRSIVRTYTVFKRVIDAHAIQRAIVEPQQHGWQRKTQAHKPQLVGLHKELKRTSGEVIDLLEKRHGAMGRDASPNSPPSGYMPR